MSNIKMDRYVPSIKMQGSKSGQLKRLMQYLPVDYSRFQIFVEPFFRTGAITFEYLNKTGFLSSYYAREDNDLLCQYYLTIYKDAESVVNKVQEYVESFNNTEDREQLYYSWRDRFNKLNPATDDNIEIASLFYMLNHTGFNGVVRVNQSNQYNVPPGSMCKGDKELSLTLSHITDFKHLCNEPHFTLSLRTSLIEFFKGITHTDKVLCYFDPPHLDKKGVITSTYLEYINLIKSKPEWEFVIRLSNDLMLLNLFKASFPTYIVEELAGNMSVNRDKDKRKTTQYILHSPSLIK
jgi:DNA adenine methylase Dam